MVAEKGAQLAIRLRRQWARAEIGATVIGAFLVFTFLHAFHSAEDPNHPASAAVIGGVKLSVYLVVALGIAQAWRKRRSRTLWRWLYEDRPPAPAERDLVLQEALHGVLLPAALWIGAVVLFSVLEIFSKSPSYAVDEALAIALGGVTTCALIYLMTERLSRPVVARALAAGSPSHPLGPRVPVRLITAWALASGVPLLGLALVAVQALGGHIHNVHSLAAAVLILTGSGLAAGAIATVLSARSVADPIASVRAALARIRSGELNVQVSVDDGSEIGLLQAGFNEMAAGLRERERLRDLFGRHVGADVARRALAEGVVLGGEAREVAVLFVDLVGSTALASRRPPEQVVSLLNRFFAIVVDAADSCGGWVNKFAGDGALCVFGAPTQQSDAPGRALAAGRLLRERLRRELPELDAGIGISAGSAVAGNVGSEQRLEYTVIGDPVNEAARLSELAKRDPRRLLASGTAVASAAPSEASWWQLGDDTLLRGRASPTRLATPVTDREVVALEPVRLGAGDGNVAGHLLGS